MFLGLLLNLSLQIKIGHMYFECNDYPYMEYITGGNPVLEAPHSLTRNKI